MCDQCKCKGLLKLHCKYCTGEFCTKCILLERHNCNGLEDKHNNDISNLRKRLVKVIAPKIQGF
jgi:predicted nucleic acid binding AN1-type Zn finger protein